MINQLVFNNTTYSFSREILNKIYHSILQNEETDDEDFAKKHVLSFITNSFILKTYEELDFHEFILDGTVRISNLLCNIDNIFGENIAKQYAEHLSVLTEEDITYLSTDILGIESSQATDIAEQIMKPDEVNKFKELISLLCLYYCVQVDYEQELKSLDGYKKITFINGIGVREEEYNGKKMLKPLCSIYDSPMNEYKTISGILVPPLVCAAIFKTELNSSFNIDDLNAEQSNLFLLKFKQLTGRNLDPVIKNYDGFEKNIDPALIGKWYRVVEPDNSPFSIGYHFSIDWFKEDMTFNRSVSFGNRLDAPINENWSNLKFTWSIKGDELLIRNHHSDIDELSMYEIKNGVLCKSGYKYYRSFADAIKYLQKR